MLLRASGRCWHPKNPPAPLTGIHPEVIEDTHGFILLLNHTCRSHRAHQKTKLKQKKKKKKKKTTKKTEQRVKPSHCCRALIKPTQRLHRPPLLLPADAGCPLCVRDRTLRGDERVRVSGMPWFSLGRGGGASCCACARARSLQPSPPPIHVHCYVHCYSTTLDVLAMCCAMRRRRYKHIASVVADEMHQPKKVHLPLRRRRIAAHRQRPPRCREGFRTCEEGESEKI